MILVRGISQLWTLEKLFQKEGRFPEIQDASILENAAMLIQHGRIAWLGLEKKLPKKWKDKKLHIKKEIHADRGIVIPGFIECHTHTIFAGSRAEEFEQRLQGVSYQEINARGGGIQSTMKATRQSLASAKSTELLLKNSQQRVDNFTRQGVTTLEIKTGYGLQATSEIKSLQLINQLQGPRILPTFLAAHSIPSDYSSAEAYLEKECIPALKKARALCSRVDIFIENGFFSKDLARFYLQLAKELDFEISIHADQLSHSGGTELAMELGALSADHVLQITDQNIQDLAKSSTTAVLLPTADLYMRCPYPRARAMIDSGVRVALATDFNPGSSPSQDLALVGLLARLEMKMSWFEVLSAYTVGASYALGLQKEIGSLSVGKSADFLLLDQDPRELFYHVGQMPLHKVFKGGRQI